MEIQQYNHLFSNLLNSGQELTSEIYILLSIDQRKDVYKQWLISQGYSSASSYVNFYPRDIKKSHNIDLFAFSKNKILLQILPEEILNIDNDKKRTSNCKSVYKKYRFFLSLIESQKILFNKAPKPKRTSITKNILIKSEWELWSDPTDDELLFAAKIITKYAKFLNPDIIEAITNDNNKNRINWISALKEKNINPNMYLWEESPCAFPGVRRYAGSREVASYRGHTTIESNEILNALKLDDNDCPKHIWSFILRGKPFQKKGPDGYSLAHIIDHKEHNNRIASEFQVEGDLSHKVFGLYTCPSNSIFVPISLLKPTDHSIKLRQLFLMKAYSLYNKQCNLFPDWMKLKSVEDNKWNIENFEWADLFGSTENVSSFLEFRYNYLEKLFHG
ncbi:MAG: hypothetical protein M3004_08630 [Bacteroidota bacterium]|nr:hypothetical protein [Bacteroidota bacterium]